MTAKLKRREFITLVGGAAAAWPLAVRAQQAGKLPTIGLLGASAASVQLPWTAAFVQRIRELGWIEDRTVGIEYRGTEGRNERAGEIAAEFVRHKVDVIVTAGTTAVAVKEVTALIPIVFTAAADPVGTGLVASLARPGGNATGLSIQLVDTAGKRLELLREIVPGVGRLAILANVGASGAVLELRDVQAKAKALGLVTTTLEIRRNEDVAPAFAALKERVDALYVCVDPLTITNRNRINILALGARLPTIYGLREFVEAGALVSYGPNFPALYRRAAELVDKILRGEKPGEIPVEQPTKFDLVVNLVTAQALGLEIPPTLLARADEVIE
jgi:putative ABC transport system substrate-binding protein